MARMLLMLLLLVGFAAPAPAGESRLDAVRGAIVVGRPRPVAVSRKELVVDLPLSIRPVGISGRIERIEFRDLALNGIPFEVDPYSAAFELPERQPLRLPAPVRIRVRFSEVGAGVVRESLLPSERLRLTGRVTVLGTYRKWFFSLRRSVEIPIDVVGPNPLAQYHPAMLLLDELRGDDRLPGRTALDELKRGLNLQMLRVPVWPF